VGTAFKPFDTSATTTTSGNRSTVYAAASYHFDKVTEVYVAGDYLHLTNGYGKLKDGTYSQIELAAGLRTRF